MRDREYSTFQGETHIFKRFSLIAHFILFSYAIVMFGQVPETNARDDAGTIAPPAIAKPVASPTPSPHTNFRKNVFRDQKAIWLSPFRLERKDLKWLIPLAATTAVLIATDHETSSWVSHSGSLQGWSKGVGLTAVSAGGVAFGSYLIGRAVNNRRAEETGVLAVEAIIDTGLITGFVKFATHRPRPNMEGGRGNFFTHGTSFPSGHSAYSWTVATVVAYEYWDRPLIRYGAFAAAVAIAASRYTGRTHFLSEVVFGSAIGFGTGRLVFRKHHRDTPAAVGDGDPAGTFSKFPSIVPYYDPKTSTYGGSLTWKF